MRSSLLILIVLGALVAGVPQKGLAQGLCRSLFQAPASHPVPAWARLKTTEEREAHLIRTLQKGAKSFQISREMANGLLALPEAAREDCMRSLGRAYRQIPKQDPNPMASWHIGGRRLLDRALTLIERYDIKFQQALTTKNPEQVLGEFFDRQNRLFGTTYGLREIKPILEYLQRQLALLPEGGPTTVITLGGSFINGKANLKSSDLDLSINSRLLLRDVPQWQKEIADLLRVTQPESNLKIEAHGEPKYFYGKINPVVIEITAHEVRLFVFAPAREHQQDLHPAEPLAVRLY